MKWVLTSLRGSSDSHLEVPGNIAYVSVFIFLPTLRMQIAEDRWNFVSAVFYADSAALPSCWNKNITTLMWIVYARHRLGFLNNEDPVAEAACRRWHNVAMRMCGGAHVYSPDDPPESNRRGHMNVAGLLKQCLEIKPQSGILIIIPLD